MTTHLRQFPLTGKPIISFYSYSFLSQRHFISPFVMNKQYLKHSSPEIFGLLNENIFHLSFSDPVNLDIHFFSYNTSFELG